MIIPDIAETKHSFKIFILKIEYNSERTVLHINIALVTV